MRTFLLLALLGPLCLHQDPTAPPSAQAKGAQDAAATDFAWLTGCWRGTGLGQTCEETWAPPLSGSMVGTFKLCGEDGVAFYEMCVLDRDAEGFALKVKHFSRAFEAWEDKPDYVRFPLREVRENHAAFDGLTFDRNGDTLVARVRLQNKGEEPRWEAFNMRRHGGSGAPPSQKR